MALSSKTIQADPRADVAMIADKIVRSDAQKIFLLVDNNARIAFHVLNFRLLRREAESAKKELIIVSSSIRVQALATKAGLKVQESRGGNARFGGEAGEAQQEEGDRIVRLGARRVSDIVQRNPQGIDSTHAMRAQQHEPRMGENVATARSARKEAFQAQKHPQETVVSEETQNMGDILREEAQVQDSLWRTFLRSRKKSASREQIVISDEAGADGQRQERQRGQHTHLHIKNSFLSFGLLRGKSIRFSFVWGSFVVAVLLIGVFVVSTVLPTVSIELTPHTQKITLQIPVHVQTTVSQVDTLHHIIPGQVIQENVEKSQTFSATSTQNVQTFATGQIRVFNQYSSVPQALVQNTRFVSQDGSLFRTTESVVVPGAQIQNGQILPSSLMVNVIAAAVGDKYNINPSTFSIPGFQGTPKFTTFYGKSEAPMKGGFSGIATVVSDSDIAQAKDALSKLASNQVQDKLKSHVPSGFVLTDDAIDQRPPVVTLSAKGGDRVDSFTGTIQNSVRAVIFRQDDVNTIVDSYVKNEYKGDPSLDPLPQPTLHYAVQSKDFDKGKFEVNAGVDQLFAARIDAATITMMVRGMSEANVHSYLASYPGIDQASVTFWPFWVHSVPDNQDRVSLKIQYPSL